MKILAIETSCDETSIAIAEFSGPKHMPHVWVFSHIVLSQIKLHAEYGGVVPNLAKREHQKNLVPILLQALHESGILNFESGKKNKRIPNSKFQIQDFILEREPDLKKQFEEKILSLPIPDIDAIAVTYGPGLAPALWVGINFAKALAVLWDKPLIPVNHMAGHLYSTLLNAEQRISNFPACAKASAGRQFPISKRIPKKSEKIEKKLSATSYELQAVTYPTLALLVSGGHTELVLMKKQSQFEIIGETLDDAAGEAFDKVARMLGLGYPGGPAISELAKQIESGIGSMEYGKIPNSKFQIRLPRPMMNSKDFNFSFSGLKTAVLYLLRDIGDKRKIKKLIPEIAKEFQDAVVDVLVTKTIRAAKEYNVKTIILGGGVAANTALRKRLREEITDSLPNAKFNIPDSRLTGDNALMIATAAYFCGKRKAPTDVGAEPNLRL